MKEGRSDVLPYRSSEQAAAFCDALWPGQAGLVCLVHGVGGRFVNGRYGFRRFRHTYWVWPDQREPLLAAVNDARDIPNEDLYVCPGLRLTPHRRGYHGAAGSNAAPLRNLWVDLDGPLADLNLLVTLDPMVVDSGGDGHQHLYVRLASPLPVGEHRVLHEALVARLGGDPGKHSDNDVLRIPGCPNRKYDPPRIPRLVSLGGAPWDPPSLRVVLELGGPGLPLTELPRPVELPDSVELPDPLPRFVRQMLAVHDRDRSKQHHRVVRACLESGLTPAQTVAVLSVHCAESVEKYGPRLAGEVLRSCARIQRDGGGRPGHFRRIEVEAQR
jgi:hypothetical protein